MIHSGPLRTTDLVQNELNTLPTFHPPLGGALHNLSRHLTPNQRSFSTTNNVLEIQGSLNITVQVKTQPREQRSDLPRQRGDSSRFPIVLDSPERTGQSVGAIKQSKQQRQPKILTPNDIATNAGFANLGIEVESTTDKPFHCIESERLPTQDGDVQPEARSSHGTVSTLSSSHVPPIPPLSQSRMNLGGLSNGLQCQGGQGTFSDFSIAESPNADSKHDNHDYERTVTPPLQQETNKILLQEISTSSTIRRQPREEPRSSTSHLVNHHHGSRSQYANQLSEKKIRARMNKSDDKLQRKIFYKELYEITFPSTSSLVHDQTSAHHPSNGARQSPSVIETLDLSGEESTELQPRQDSTFTALQDIPGSNSIDSTDLDSRKRKNVECVGKGQETGHETLSENGRPRKVQKSHINNFSSHEDKPSSQALSSENFQSAPKIRAFGEPFKSFNSGSSNSTKRPAQRLKEVSSSSAVITGVGITSPANCSATPSRIRSPQLSSNRDDNEQGTYIPDERYSMTVPVSCRSIM